MKFTKQDLLTMLIGLFLFSSCKDANTIGLDTDDDALIGATLYDQAEVTSRTEIDAPVTTVSLTRHPLGELNDPVLGNTKASIAMTVNTPGMTSFGTNVEIDSAVLVLPYSSQFYGDSTQVYSLTVRPLTVDMTTKKSFLSNIQWPVDGNTILGSYNGRVRPTTRLTIDSIITGKADTLRTVAPQIRIQLTKAFIKQRIADLDSAKLTNNVRFADSFKGLHISASVAGSSRGGMMFFNFTGSAANLEIYYKKNGTTSGTRDTVSSIFPINTTSGPVAATVSHDYSNAPAIQEQLDNPTQQYAVTYLQSMSGLRNRIAFPDLAKLKEKLGVNKLGINKAELVIDLSADADTYFLPAQRLSLYRYDIAGQRKNVPDNDNFVSGVTNGDPGALGSEVLFGGYFDSVNRRYIFNISSYVKYLINGTTQDYGTYLSVTPSTEFNLFPFSTTAYRSILLQPKNNAAAGEKRMKLNIYYTKVN